MTQIADPENENRIQEIALGQWQTCVEMANSISTRRDAMNSLFVTFNIAIMAAASYVWNERTALLSATGIALSIVWILFIKYYRALNQAKYDMILKIEENLPFEPFRMEWDEFKRRNHLEGTIIELVLPIVFLVLNATTALLVLR